MGWYKNRHLEVVYCVHECDFRREMPTKHEQYYSREVYMVMGISDEWRKVECGKNILSMSYVMI